MKLERRSIRGWIGAVADVATIFIACVLVVFVVQIRSQGPTATRRSSVGAAKLSSLVTSVEGKKDARVLVLALSTHCHFCTESAPFFRNLRERADTQKLHMVAVLPETPEDSRTYIAKQGYGVDEIRQVSLSTLGVAGTPTILLLDSDGTVLRKWVGKLTLQQQQEALAAIFKGKIS